MEDDAGVRERDEEESAEEKDQRLWDELFARAQGATARPLPTLGVVDGVVRIVAPGATFYERYAPYYRVRQQNDGGVDFIQMQCKLGCGSKWANVATKGTHTAIEFSNNGKHLRVVHPQMLALVDQGSSGAKRKGQSEASGEAEVEEAAPKFRGSEERVRFAKLVLTNGLPTSFGESAGWTRYAHEHHIETYSRKTLVAVINGLRDDLITKPREVFLKEALKTVTISVEGAAYEFETPLSGLGCDGWTRIGGGGMETGIGFAGTLYSELGKPTMLLPAHQHLFVRHWKPKVNEMGETNYDAKDHAREMAETLRSINIDPRRILKLNADTTAGQQKIGECEEFSGAGIANLASKIELEGAPPKTGLIFCECGQHVSNLCGVDCNKNETFSSACDAATNVSDFIRKSDKAWLNLEKMQQAMLSETPKELTCTRPVRPLGGCRTRFLVRLIVNKRSLDIAPALSRMAASNTLDAKAKAAYNALMGDFSSKLPQLQSIDKLFKPLLKLSPGFGCADRYTASLRPLIFWTLMEESKVMKASADGAIIPAVVDRYQASLVERFAAVKIQKAMREKHTLPPGTDFGTDIQWKKYAESPFYPRLLLRDQMDEAAAYLDPGMRPYLVKIGVSSTNAVSTMLQLLKGCVVVAPKAPSAGGGSNAAAGAGGLMAAAGSPAELCRAEIKAITDEKEPEFADTAEWLRDRARRIVAVRVKYGGPGAAVDAPAAAAGKDPLADFERALRADLEKEQQILESRLNDVLSKNPDVFGNPLDFEKPRNSARHAWWPANADGLQLHFFCAKVLLGGQLTSTENERFHSVLGYICSKLRASISDANLEYYGTAMILLKRDIKEPADGLDAADAADKLLEPVE